MIGAPNVVKAARPVNEGTYQLPTMRSHQLAAFARCLRCKHQHGMWGGERGAGSSMRLRITMNSSPCPLEHWSRRINDFDRFDCLRRMSSEQPPSTKRLKSLFRQREARGLFDVAEHGTTSSRTVGGGVGRKSGKIDGGPSRRALGKLSFPLRPELTPEEIKNLYLCDS